MLSIDIGARAGELEIDVRLADLDRTTLIVGPNGSGKSSLLKCILGVLEPTRGSIRIGDTVIFDSEAGVNVLIEERRIGYVPQSYALFPHMTARQNVEFGLGRGTSRDVLELMEHLEITHVADRKASVLSGGESQRVALARALAPGPRLLLLDEPLAALDQTARRKVRGFLGALLEELEIPAVVVSHEREDLKLGDRVVIIEAGRIVQAGTKEELSANPATDFSREFLGGNW